MPRTPIDILFPFKGLHEGAAYARQPQGTTPSCLNVIGRDPVTDRLRGGSRPGTRKYLASAVNGANPITAGICVTKIDNRVTYTTRTSIGSSQIVAQTAQPSRLDTVSMASDQQGNIFCAAATSGGGTGLNCLVKYNSALVRQWVYALPQGRPTDVLKSVRLSEDPDGRLGIYCVVTGSGSSGGPTRIYKFAEDFLDNVRLEWYLDAPNGGWWTDCSVADGVMYALELTTTPTTYLHRYSNIGSLVPTPDWVDATTGISGKAIRTGTGAEEAYCITHADDGAALVGIVDPAVINANGAIEKFGPMSPDETTPATATSAGSLARWTTRGTLTSEQGLGQSIVNKGGYLFTNGYGSGGSNYRVRRIKDLGATVSDSGGDGALAQTLDGNTTFVGANSLVVDDDLNVYVTTDSTTTDTVVTKLAAADFTKAWEITGATLGVTDMNAYALLLHPRNADTGGTDEQAEFLYVGTESEASNYYTLHKVRLVDVTQADGSARTTFNYAVCNGALRHVTRDGANALSGTASISTTERFVCMAAGLNRVLITDGLSYFSIDPLTGTYGTVSAWAATSGEIPPRARQVYIWGGAAVLVDFEHNPHQWAMSAVGDFDDWNFFPVRPDNADAVLGSDSRAGVCPDIITTFIPIFDDLALFGGDHTIQRMDGHPLEGGRFALVTDITGIARGPGSWCKTPNGTIYFVGSRGGFFSITPGSLPTDLTLEPLSDRFRDIDIGANKFHLVWDDRLKGVWVFITPYAGSTTTHWFWSAREDAWWPIRFASESLDPLAVWVFDGDAPGDRAILIGGKDGIVREFAEDAASDDGLAIDSWVYLPVLGGQHTEIRLSNFRPVLSHDSDAVDFRVYSLDNPDFNLLSTDALSATTNISAGVSKTLEASRGNNIRDRIRGNALLVRLRNSTAGRRWAMETLAADLEPAGRARTRHRHEAADETLIVTLTGWGDNYGSDTNNVGALPDVFYGLAFYRDRINTGGMFPGDEGGIGGGGGGGGGIGHGPEFPGDDSGMPGPGGGGGDPHFPGGVDFPGGHYIGVEGIASF